MAKAPIRSAFEGTNDAAQRAAERQAAKMVTAIAEETRDNIRNLVVRAINEGIPPYDAARSIRSMVGLTAKQGQAAMNYRAGLIDRGLTPDRVDTLLNKYTAKQLRSRAETISRTEVMRSLNDGQSDSWREAKSQGLLGPNAKKEWETVDNACPRCGGMSGRQIPIEASFSPDPPLHPRCRCTIVLVV